MTFAHARIIVITLAAAAAAGCAQQAVRPAAGGAAAPSSAAMATTPAAHGKTYGIPPQLLQMARDDGYRPMVRDGEAIFCRREIPTGSTLPRTHCVNSTGLRFEIQREQRERRALEHQAPMVGQPSGN